MNIKVICYAPKLVFSCSPTSGFEEGGKYTDFTFDNANIFLYHIVNKVILF